MIYNFSNKTFKISSGVHNDPGSFGELLAVYNSILLQYHNILRPDGTVIGRREGSDRLYYHRDHLGSTRAVVNASGTVVETQDYYPFGLAELVPKTFGMPGRSMTTGNSAKEKFTSHELDDEVDLYYMIARRYAPEFGRFLSVDPLANRTKPNDYIYHSIGSYTYSLNNPVLYKDENGLWVVTAQFSIRALPFLVSGGGSVGLALDDKGNLAFIASGNLGAGLGVGAAGGLEFSIFPAAQTVDEINGLGATAGGFFGIPTNFVSAEGNLAFMDDDFRAGFSFSGIPGTGTGAGIGAFAELSFTHVSKSLRFNLFDIFKGGQELNKDNKTVRKLQRQLGISSDETVVLLKQLRVLFDSIQEQNQWEEEKEKEGE